MKLISIVKELFILSFATLIIAAAVFFFLLPSHTSISSISGLSIVLANFVPFTMSQITMFLNVILLIIGFFTCGSEFGYKTVYTSILLPVYLGIFEKLFPNIVSLTGDSLLDVICYTFVVSIGLAILFNRNASSGGLDIVAKILNKYCRIEMGKALSVAGICIALSSYLAYDIKTVVLSLLGTYLNGIVLDHFIFDHNLKRRVCIVSPKIDDIRNYILNDLHSGATLYKAIGAYHLDEHEEIITIVDKHEFQKLMTFIDTVDPQAFVTVYQVSNIQYRPKSLPERKFD
ncbi:YitT family protein [Oribacterium sp. WCC10]|uniref:YitT family protein n=1 Tax=Oribacterium sp. WCC10 TaxID=1855343 RepID=UPI0008EBAC40|nr:YitT family protein [Oribacterium sp. WCC10]SFG66756.1 Uncharacterized membrane-anchored protein YitT, contains DUF161 and DUF2179 domains [Oribacterium sp. WCC10]